MDQVKMKVRAGRSVNGKNEGEIVTVSPEQADQIERQGAADRVKAADARAENSDGKAKKGE